MSLSEAHVANDLSRRLLRRDSSMSRNDADYIILMLYICRSGENEMFSSLILQKFSS